MKFTYLLIDLFSVLVPFLFSFHPRLRFYRHWAAALPAMVLTGALFIGWDMYFTHLKIWGFNPDYLIGVYIGNLPIEEVLFFACIPYSCVFTYTCLTVILKPRLSKRNQLIISILLIVVSIIVATRFHNLSYTAYTFALLAALVVTAQFIMRASWLSRFYIAYLILLLPFVIVNGLLTGTGLQNPVVWYNSAHIIGPRILTIPIEDVFYGMDLILLNVMIYHSLRAKIYQNRKTRRKAAGPERQDKSLTLIHFNDK